MTTKPRKSTSKTKQHSQLIVLGMHRSGTSAMTGVMESLGAFVGEKDELTATSWENPKGFFERQDMRRLCDALLHSAGADWWKIDQFTPEAVPAGTRKELEPEIKLTLKDLDSHGTWAVKEPRLCLLLPLLEPYLSNPAVIFISRNPLEVAKSLRRRNGFSIDAGLALWEAYNIAALRHSAHLPRVFISYEALTAKPDATIAKLAKDLKKLGAEGLADTPAASVIEQELHREQADNEEFSHRLTDAQKTLWNALSAGKVDKLSLELSYNARCILREFAEDEGTIRGLRADLKHQKAVNERDAKNFQKVIQKRETDLAIMTQKASIRARELRNVYDSSSWRLTAPLRAIAKRSPLLADYGRKGLRLGKRLATLPLRDALRQRAALRHRERLFSEAAKVFEQEGKADIAGLLSYLRAGMQEERRPIVRELKHWNYAREDVFLKGIDMLYQRDAAGFDAIPAAVVMPTWNRESSVAAAIESVLAQTHPSLELYVVDDGSDDNTPAIVEALCAKDARLHYLRPERGGVSKARNHGLQAINDKGEARYVFYLDSDNTWHKHYIRSMVVYMETGKLDAAYAGIQAMGDNGTTDFFRGEDFDWRSCHQGNYVDLNCFAHRRDAAPKPENWFDTTLRRTVDWDVILRLTARRRTSFAPFLAVSYYNGDGGGRITKTENVLDIKEVRAKVQGKHKPEDIPLFSASELRPVWTEIFWSQLQQRIALKIPAPYEQRAEWGDYHYAESLKAALERMGHAVTIDFAGEWDKRSAADDDIVIVLRGLYGYKPKPQHINVLWNISHPDQVAYEEYDRYDLVCVASLSYAAFLRTVTRAPVACLLQCTDTSRFHPVSSPREDAADTLFVGNSRNEYRDIVRWAIEAEADLSVYGTRWDGFIDRKLVKGKNIPNEELGSHYGSARAVLNDHWASMRDYGLVSNRIFDVLASGGTLISDQCHSSGYLFGEAVQQVSNAEEAATALRHAHKRSSKDKQDMAEHVMRHHSFGARAYTLMHHVFRAIHKEAPGISDDVFTAMPYIRRDKPRTLTVVTPAQQPLSKLGKLFNGTQRSLPPQQAYTRLLSPLTHDVLAGKLLVQTCPVDKLGETTPSDCLITQPAMIRQRNEAQHLFDHTAKSGSKLVIDHSTLYAKGGIAELLAEKADQNWFATADMAQACNAQNRYIIPDALDARIWRNYRKDRLPIGQQAEARLVYIPQLTQGTLEPVWPALEALAKQERFSLTVIGTPQGLPNHDWIQILQPDVATNDYPRFVRWLAAQGQWDIGLAPLGDTATQSDAALLTYMALGVLPIASDVAAYQGEALEHEAVLLAANTSNGWHKLLESTIRQRSELQYMVERGHHYLWHEHDGEASALLQWQALQQL